MITNHNTLDKESETVYTIKNGYVWNKAIPENEFTDSRFFKGKAGLKPCVSNCTTIEEFLIFL